MENAVKLCFGDLCIISTVIFAILKIIVESLEIEWSIELIYIQIYLFFDFFFYTLPQVRMKLVKNWLPVLIVCKDVLSQPTAPNHKTVYMELEETLLRIISTLPMSDAQDLLKQCLSFSTRNVDDCPHLVTAFNTWFRRANRPPKPDNTLH